MKHCRKTVVQFQACLQIVVFQRNYKSLWHLAVLEIRKSIITTSQENFIMSIQTFNRDICCVTKKHINFNTASMCLFTMINIASKMQHRPLQSCVRDIFSIQILGMSVHWMHKSTLNSSAVNFYKFTKQQYRFLICYCHP